VVGTMINVPMDLLRTFIAVTDLRSFTRAAQALGVTQPAVSAQIKRLQMLLGAELFDKSAPGVTLTAKGEIIVNYARRVLALNDQMLDVTSHGGPVARLRIGLAMDYFEGPILQTLAEFRKSHPELRMQISAEPSASLLRDLRRGDYDLVVAASDSEQTDTSSRRWTESSAWGAASASVMQSEGPIPLLVVGENSLSRRLSVSALERAGQDYQIVYVGGSFAGMVRAAQAGLGVACWARRCLVEAGLTVLDGVPRLPAVPDAVGGVHLREGFDSPEMAALADMITAAVASGQDAGYRELARRSAAAF
jgi:DNA-binding transcriptional LysR family regulator